MNQTHYLRKIKTAIKELETANHAQLLMTIAKSYKTTTAQAAVGAAILKMLSDCTEASAESVLRIVRGEDDSLEAMQPEAAALELSRHYTDAVCTACPDLNRADVESDLTVAAILILNLTIKGAVDGVKSFIERKAA